MSEDTRLQLALNVEQGTPEWLNARKSLITASDFGSASGFNKYKSRPQFLREKLGESSFSGNHLTAWGTRFEDTACDLYCAHMRSTCKNFSVRHTGLIVLGEPRPYIGLSPDGLIQYEDENGQTQHGLLEIKCPRFHRKTIPSYYYCQIMGICGYMHLLRGRMQQEFPAPTFCDFVEMTLASLQITRYHYDDDAQAFFRTMDSKLSEAHQLLRLNQAKLERNELELRDGVLRGRLQTRL